jgi:hypothetical protein
VGFPFLTPRELRARPDAQACPTARPQHVRPRPTLHRSLSPDWVRGTIFPKPFDPTIRTSHPTRSYVVPHLGAFTAIENP